MTTNYQASNSPAAWTSAGVGGKAGLSRQINAEERAAITAFLDATEGRESDSIRPEELSPAPLAALMAEVRETLVRGRGAVVLTGLDIAGWPEERFARLYWALGTQLGQGVPQSYRGDRIGRVQKEENNPTGRGYLMDVELRAHTDFHEILSLACVRKSDTGGTSALVSSLALHDAILATKPELLGPLYEGYYHESAGGGEVSGEKVPIFARVDDVLTCYYHVPFMLNAARQLGTEIPADLRAAMDYMNSLALDPEIRADFMLEPGEMMFWHNFTALHAREAFNDTPEHRRLLLRLWINAADSKPMPDIFHARARYMDQVHGKGEAAIDYARAAAA